MEHAVEGRNINRYNDLRGFRGYFGTHRVDNLEFPSRAPPSLTPVFFFLIELLSLL
jgi:hypothetical protein